MKKSDVNTEIKSATQESATSESEPDKFVPSSPVSDKSVSELTLKLDKVIEICSNISKNDDSYESAITHDLNKAMANAILEFPKIKINRQNPYLASGYADLHEIMTTITPILGKHGLSIIQQTKPKDGVVFLITRLWHSSGQWIESRAQLSPTKNTITAYGSNLNSMKRFEVMNILGITVSEDPFDDDGESDMEANRDIVAKGTEVRKLFEKKESSYETISNEEYNQLMIDLDNEEDLVEEMLEELHIRSLRELPKSRYRPTVDRIRKIKQIRYSPR